ncbi:UNVERIFIED_CONTAM: hypothetical protein FKN15_009259 [Acipenser sinensis]
MDRNLKLLSQREELQLKKEVERLRKQSQKDFLHYTQQISSSSRKRTSPTVMAESVPGQSPQTDSLKRTRNHTNASKNKNTLDSKNFVDSPEVQKDILNSSPTFLLGDPKPERFPNQVKDLKAMIKGVAACYQEDKGHENYKKQKKLCEDEGLLNSGTSEHADKAARKPVIALIDGTTKAVTISKRPQPPQRPKYKPVVRTRARILKSPFIEEVEKPISINKPKTSKVRMQSTNSQKSLKTESSSNDSEHSDDSLSEDSEDSASADDSGKEKNKMRKKQKKFKTERPISVVPDEVTIVEPGIPGSRKSSVGSSHSQSVRSTSQLLEEAKDIARTGASIINKQNIQHREPKEDTAKLPVRESGRTIDEVIASLQSGSHRDSLSTSDQMVKELTERVLGHSSKCETSRMFTEMQSEQQVSVKDVEETENGSVDLTSMIRSKDTPFSLDLSFPCEQDSSEIDDLIKISQLPKQETKHSVEGEELYCDLQDLNEPEYVDLDAERRAIMSCLIRKSISAPNLSTETKTELRVPSDFKTLSNELELAKLQQLSRSKAQAKIEVSSSSTNPLMETPSAQFAKLEAPDQINKHSPVLQPHIKGKMSNVEAARNAGMKYIIHPRKKKTTQEKKKLSPQKLAFVHDKLNQPARTLKRCKSLLRLHRTIEPSLRVPEKSRHYRSSSLPLMLNFERFTEDHGGIPENVCVREWVRDIWNSWFDEVFPPPENVKVSAAKTTKLPYTETKKIVEKPQPDEETPVPDQIDLSLALGPSINTADLQNEIDKITQYLAEEGSSNAFNFCRRGALYKKMGNLKLALEDLNKSISIEPGLLDAYWHRHCISLLKGNQKHALDDLHFIIKHNKNHADAYMSKAEIYRSKGDITMSIVNYTRAIKARPEDDEAYFRRAQMFEKSNEKSLAIDDYAKASTINPKRTDALMIHGLHFFKNLNWSVAIQDFTAVMKHEPLNAKARTYRGRAYAKQGHYQQAVEDLSAAVHLDPNNWIAFYHRGCLLRKSHCEIALRDLSVSVLINDSVDNLNAFLHRGILYTELNQWMQAICDFEHVLKLDRYVAVAHMNLGLIFMLKMENHYEAIRRFTSAIKIDPTCNRAYVCRAEAYNKALEAFTSAVKINPEHADAFYQRGLCKMRLQQATSVHDFNRALAANPNLFQVYLSRAAFYGEKCRYSKAVLNCNEAIKIHPKSVRAYLYRGALKFYMKDFKAATMINPEDPAIFNALGICHHRLGQLAIAIDAFNQAIKLKPFFLDAYVGRGNVYMDYGHEAANKQAQRDFLTALHLNPACSKARINLGYNFQLNKASDELITNRGVIHQFMGDHSNAMKDYQRAITINPHYALAYFNAANIYFYNRQFEQASEYYTKAFDLDPSNESSVLNRAITRTLLRNVQGALEDFKEALNLSPFSAQIYFNRANLYISLKQYQLAENDLSQALLLQPRDALVYKLRADVRGQLGLTEQAILDYKQAVELQEATQIL